MHNVHAAGVADAGVVDCGYAAAQVLILGLNETCPDIPLGVGWQQLMHQSLGRLVQHPVRLSTGRKSAYATSGGVRRFVVNPGLLQRGRVGREHVPGVVDDRDGMLRRRGVQVVARGVPHILEAGIIVAPAANPIAGQRYGCALPQAVNDVADVAVGRRSDVHLQQIGAIPDHVVMRFDKTGQHRLALGVDYCSATVSLGDHVVVSTQYRYPAVSDAHRLHHAVVGVHGLHSAVDDDQVHVIHSVAKLPCRVRVSESGVYFNTCRPHSSG